jgi:hypothetical protein
MRILQDVTKKIVQNIITSIIIALLFFLWSDYIYKQPDLNGRWYFTVDYEKTSLLRFVGLKVTYEVILIQDGLKISGRGEKIEEIYNEVKKTYTGKSRVPIEINGNIDFNYLNNDKLNLSYREFGSKRESATFHKLIRFDDTKMTGIWKSTIADSSGSVSWVR